MRVKKNPVTTLGDLELDVENATLNLEAMLTNLDQAKAAYKDAEAEYWLTQRKLRIGVDIVFANTQFFPIPEHDS